MEAFRLVSIVIGGYDYTLFGTVRARFYTLNGALPSTVMAIISALLCVNAKAWIILFGAISGALWARYFLIT